MIDRKKLLLYSLTPVFACSLFIGAGHASGRPASPQTTATNSTQTTDANSASSKRAAKKAAKKAAKEEKSKQAAAANSNAAAPASTPMSKSEPPKTATRRTPSTMGSTASSGDIANAKAIGLVWVNTESKVYHKDGKYYGNTKHGQFMTEADAQKAGYKASKR